MNIELTKDSEYMICSIYKEYVDKKKSGMSKGDAKFIGGSEYIHKALMPEWSFEDVDETCRELDRAGLLECLYADGINSDSALTDKAIIYMENRFVNGLTQVLEYMAKIKAAILF